MLSQAQASAKALLNRYVAFAKAHPLANSMILGCANASAADFVAQRVVEGKSWNDVDWKRSLVFCSFGALYLGGFQYVYQVGVFRRIFAGTEKFTNQAWAAKLKDVPGLISLGAQAALDLSVMTCIYLPSFYVFKAGVYSSSWSASDWAREGVSNYWRNCSKDVYDMVRVWGPADLLCFSVPLWLRLPVRMVISFTWTTYLSFMRGAK
jgi:hypothetical protein